MVNLKHFENLKFFLSFGTIPIKSYRQRKLLNMITLMKIQTEYYSTQMKQNPKFIPHLVISDLGLGQLELLTV